MESHRDVCIGASGRYSDESITDSNKPPTSTGSLALVTNVKISDSTCWDPETAARGPWRSGKCSTWAWWSCSHPTWETHQIKHLTLSRADFWLLLQIYLCYLWLLFCSRGTYLIWVVWDCTWSSGLRRRWSSRRWWAAGRRRPTGAAWGKTGWWSGSRHTHKHRHISLCLHSQHMLSSILSEHLLVHPSLSRYIS